MLHYLETGMMENISKKEVAGDIVEVLAITLDAEDDEDGHLTSLNIISDLMGKSKPDSKWLDYFAKLGVYSKVQVLCDNQDTDVMEIETVGDSGIIQEDGATGGEVTDIVAGNVNIEKIM